MIEELGDYAFYLVAVRSIFSPGFGDAWNVQKPIKALLPSVNCAELMRLGGHFWDVVKRIVIYRKPADAPDSKYAGSTLNQVAIRLLGEMEDRFHALCFHYGVSLEDVLEANWNKLANADTGRYASGSYSDEQAQERRDERRTKV